MNLQLFFAIILCVSFKNINPETNLKIYLYFNGLFPKMGIQGNTTFFKRINFIPQFETKLLFIWKVLYWVNIFVI